MPLDGISGSLIQMSDYGQICCFNLKGGFLQKTEWMIS